MDLFHIHHMDDVGIHHDIDVAGDSGHDHLGMLESHDSAGMLSHQDILGSHSDVPWLNFGSHAAHHDSDHDGIPDTLDHAVSPGAEPGILGTHVSVPWIKFGPDAMQHDVDGDGIPDALDNRVGPGA